MIIKIPKRTFNRVVVGGTLEALAFSHEQRLPLIINSAQKPHRFAQGSANLSAFEVWHELYYKLSNMGLNLLGTKAHSVRLKDGLISVTTSDARVIKFNYNHAVIFDDEGVSGLPEPVSENKDFIVLDWMVCKSCETHSHDFWKHKGGFVKEVYFYPSDRLDGHHPNLKDIVAISYLNEEQLINFEYSDTYAKFKVMSLMKEAGIGGRRCGGNNQYALDVEVEKREIFKAKMNKYPNTDKLEFK